MVMRCAPVRTPPGLKASGALEKIVGGIAVEKRSDAGAFGFQIGIADDDQAFFFVGDVEKTVEKMDGLLFIFGELLAQRIDAERRR